MRPALVWAATNRLATASFPSPGDGERGRRQRGSGGDAFQAAPGTLPRSRAPFRIDPATQATYCGGKTDGGPCANSCFFSVEQSRGCRTVPCSGAVSDHRHHPGSDPLAAVPGNGANAASSRVEANAASNSPSVRSKTPWPVGHRHHPSRGARQADRIPGFVNQEAWRRHAPAALVSRFSRRRSSAPI